MLQINNKFHLTHSSIALSPKAYMARLPVSTYLVTSGSHWTVRLGHSKAWVITKSYKNGVFFFQILYSSLIILSSTASSKGS